METNEKHISQKNDFSSIDLICDNCEAEGKITKDLIHINMYQIRCPYCGNSWKINKKQNRMKTKPKPITYEEFRELVWRLHVHGGDARFKADMEATKGYAETQAVVTTLLHMKTFCDKWIKKMINTPIHY